LTVLAAIVALAAVGIAPSSAQTTEEHQALVQRSYNDVLGRSPESPAFETWVSELDGGLARSEYAFALLDSDEFRRVIVNVFYGIYLDREADPTALAAFAPVIDGGSSWEHVESLILGSDEFFNNEGGDNTSFVTALYGRVLGRAPDQPGADFFLEKLDEGWSRQMVAGAVVLSAEGRRNFINIIYESLLLRPVDEPSLNVWITTPYQTIAVAIIASDEYFTLAVTP
jgi:GR25 family glycosyltransferase involved in LPS biosynthesis